MRLLSLSLVIPILVTIANSAPLLQDERAIDTPTLPFSFQYLFTATILATQPIGGVPLPLGGVQYASSVTGGNITGPIGNGTVYSGAAYLRYNDKKTYSNAGIILYGNFSDGAVFNVQEDSVSTSATHVNRLYININGSNTQQQALYNNVTDGYVLAKTTAAPDGSSYTLSAWLVLNPK